jgi:hypothetical protein
VLRALGATTAAFDVLQHTDLGNVLADQHHTELHSAADPGPHTFPGGATVYLDGTGAFSTPAGGVSSHVLATGTALGPDQTISGAAAGEVLRALGATTAAFDVLQHTDLGNVLADQHHAQVHAIGGANHSGQSGVATEYLDGTGAYSVPAGGGGGGLSVDQAVSNSMAANPDAAPSESWLIRSTDAGDVTGTGLVTFLTFTGVPVGRYLLEAWVVWQATALTTGVRLVVDYLGTVTMVVVTRHGLTALATATNGIADQDVATNTGGVVQGWAGRADAANLGPSAGVDTINANQLEYIRAIIEVSTSANLVMQSASEAAGLVTRVKANTAAMLRRLA